METTLLKKSDFKLFLSFYILIMLSLSSSLTAGMCKSVFSDLYLELKLPVRIVSLLNQAGINTVKELISKTPQELLRLPHFGRASLEGVEEVLAGKGLFLKASARSLEPGDISILNLSVRSQNALRAEGIHTVKELVSRTPEELLGIRNLGINSLIEIEEVLKRRDLSLRASARSLEPGDISILNLSVRSQNALRAEGIHTVKELMSKAPLELLREIIFEKEQK
ncbi:MAG: helix-hairpin-helix domain-containing protein [Oligoflexia bacterium]|nr:helix-hairpin-helix domain-containing protein [Oligoflexia bacterium]